MRANVRMGWARRAQIGGVVGALSVLGACSLSINADRVQCSADSECQARGGANASCVEQVCVVKDAGPSGPWQCLGSVAWPASTTKKVKIAVMVVDVMTSKPPEGLHIRVCPKLDAACSSPLSATAELAASGMVEATIDAGFDGYLELTSNTITPALFFLTKPVWEDTTVVSVVPVVSPEGFQGIAQAIGTTLDLETMGHAYVLATDCTDTSAAGVRFEIDKKNAQTASYYMINNVPVGTQPATDASGSGGFLNLTPGYVKVTGYVSSTGARIGETGFVVRKGAVSYPRLLPSP